MSDTPHVSLSDLIFPAYRKAWKSRKQNLVLGGSKGSGKSKFAALRVIMDVMENPDVTNALVIRKVFGTCRDSVYTDLLWAIDQLGVTEFWQYTVSPMQMVYKPTGQLILFRGLDDPLKLASIMVRTGLITTVWFEEAFEISNYEDVLKVNMSIRGVIPEGSKAFKRFIFTFNPWSEHHWLKKEFFDQQREDTLAFITTYKDNLKLGEDDIARYELLKETNPHAARVICDGEWGRAEGLIYDNWLEEDFDPYEILKSRHVVPAFGLDFGYSISFNAFVASLVDAEGQELWIYDEWYCQGVTNLDIAKAITDMGYSKEKIIADCAEPKSIYDLRTGIVDGKDDGTGVVTGIKYSLPNIQPALKGKDSIRLGISTLQGFKMHVHPKCRNVITELSNYAWKTDKDGNYMDEPAKEWDHAMDALRYSISSLFLKGHGGVAEAKGVEGAKYIQRSKRVFATVEATSR